MPSCKFVSGKLWDTHMNLSVWWMRTEFSHHDTIAILLFDPVDRRVVCRYPIYRKTLQMKWVQTLHTSSLLHTKESPALQGTGLSLCIVQIPNRVQRRFCLDRLFENINMFCKSGTIVISNSIQDRLWSAILDINVYRQYIKAIQNHGRRLLLFSSRNPLSVNSFVPKACPLQLLFIDFTQNVEISMQMLRQHGQVDHPPCSKLVTDKLQMKGYRKVRTVTKCYDTHKKAYTHRLYAHIHTNTSPQTHAHITIQIQI